MKATSPVWLEDGDCDSLMAPIKDKFRQVNDLLDLGVNHLNCNSLINI